MIDQTKSMQEIQEQYKIIDLYEKARDFFVFLVVIVITIIFVSITTYFHFQSIKYMKCADIIVVQNLIYNDDCGCNHAKCIEESENYKMKTFLPAIIVMTPLTLFCMISCIIDFYEKCKEHYVAIIAYNKMKKQ